MSRTTLAAAGVLFLLYPLVRPWHDETTAAGALESMGSAAWIASHLFAMIGFILVPLGLLAMRERIGLGPVVAAWVGAGLTLPYYGAEDFGLHGAASAGSADTLLATADAVRYHAVPATMFAVGLLTLGAAAVWVAVTLWRTEVRYAATVFAAGFVLFIPQFYLPPAARIAHGVVMLVGCVWLGIATATRTRELSRQGAA
jgi:hypothetical protein